MTARNYHLFLSATLAALSLGAITMAPNAHPADAARTVVRPPDTGAALENPMMGWVLHFYDN
ncbi:MAG: hypothetical protein MUQ65_17800, partial [Armatimonadetes bacterium]|nr:hypothetical protein [Armatimonadota bacterium]